MKTAYTINPKYCYKNLYMVIDNNHKKRIVKAPQELLEKLFQENQIFEYALLAPECWNEFKR